MTRGTTCAWYGLVGAGSWQSSKMAKEIINQLGFEQAHLMLSLKVNKSRICFTLMVLH